MSNKLPLELEAEFVTNESAAHHDPCVVASCRKRREVVIGMALGGRVVPAGVCRDHEQHWARADVRALQGGREDLTPGAVSSTATPDELVA